jgi:hypothetical protein
MYPTTCDAVAAGIERAGNAACAVSAKVLP